MIAKVESVNFDEIKLAVGDADELMLHDATALP